MEKRRPSSRQKVARRRLSAAASQRAPSFSYATSCTTSSSGTDIWLLASGRDRVRVRVRVRGEPRARRRAAAAAAGAAAGRTSECRSTSTSTTPIRERAHGECRPLDSALQGANVAIQASKVHSNTTSSTTSEAPLRALQQQTRRPWQRRRSRAARAPRIRKHPRPRRRRRQHRRSRPAGSCRTARSKRQHRWAEHRASARSPRPRARRRAASRL